MYSRKCKYCGAHLDPGELCDCYEMDVPEIEEAMKAPKRYKVRSNPHEYDSLDAASQQRYIERLWNDYAYQ